MSRNIRRASRIAQLRRIKKEVRVVDSGILCNYLRPNEGHTYLI